MSKRFRHLSLTTIDQLRLREMEKRLRRMIFMERIATESGDRRSSLFFNHLIINLYESIRRVTYTTVMAPERLPRDRVSFESFTAAQCHVYFRIRKEDLRHIMELLRFQGNFCIFYTYIKYIYNIIYIIFIIYLCNAILLSLLLF